MIEEKNYKERMLIEYRELIIRISKMECFFREDRKEDEQKIELMHKQIEIMNSYRSILEERFLLELNK